MSGVVPAILIFYARFRQQQIKEAQPKVEASIMP